MAFISYRSAFHARSADTLYKMDVVLEFEMSLMAHESWVCVFACGCPSSGQLFFYQGNITRQNTGATATNSHISAVNIYQVGDAVCPHRPAKTLYHLHTALEIRSEHAWMCLTQTVLTM